MQEQFDYQLKCLLIGDTDCGKPELLTALTKPNPGDIISSIGVNFRVRTEVFDETKVALQIWDTAGQERFRTINSSYYRGSHIFLCVFDFTNPVSFESLRTSIAEAKRYVNDGAQFVLVGTKAQDITNRRIDLHTAQEFATNLELTLVEVRDGDYINLEKTLRSCVQTCFEALQAKSTAPKLF